MTMAMQIGLFAASVVFIVLAVMAMRLVMRLTVLAREAERAIAETHAQRQKMQEILSSVGQMVHSMNGVERVVHRATAMTSGALDEVEAPLRAVVAMLHAVRAGAGFFLRSQFTANGSPETSGVVKGERDVSRSSRGNGESHG